MKKYLFFCLLIILGSVSCHASEFNSPTRVATNSKNPLLTLTIKLDKNNYKLGEDILVDLRITSADTNNTTIKNRMVPGIVSAPLAYRDVALIIKDKNNKEVPFIARIHARPPTKDQFITLSSGQSIRETINIGKLYYFWSKEFGPGVYKIYAIFYNDYSPVDFPIAWLGKIVSNTTIFTIQ